MSISSIGQSNVLGEDVLQIIFQHLDAEDLLKCEAVCRQWRDILLAGTPWRRLYHRNIGRLRLWRKAQKKLESDQKTLPTEQYPGICKGILTCLQQVDRNWRRGHFAILTYPVSSYCARYISMNEDYVAWDISRYRASYKGLYGKTCAFLNTESMENNETLTYFSFLKHLSFVGCYSEMLLFHRTFGNLEIANRKTRCVVNVWDGLDEEEKKSLCYKFGSKLLVTYCYFQGSDSKGIRIRIWKIENPPVLVHDRLCKYDELVKMDDQFIVFSSAGTSCFISAENFEEFRTVTWRDYCREKYDRGLLFRSTYPDDGSGIIRIFDVTSGTFFNDVRLPIRNNTRQSVELMTYWASSNSRFVVIGWTTSSSGIFKFSNLSFYDLEAVKKPSSDRSCYLYTLQIQCPNSILEFDEYKHLRFLMDESRIVFNGIHGDEENNVTVLDFADFNEPKTSDSENSEEESELESSESENSDLENSEKESELEYSESEDSESEDSESEGSKSENSDLENSEEESESSEDSDLEDKPETRKKTKKPKTKIKILFDPYVDSLPLDDAEMMDT